MCQREVGNIHDLHAVAVLHGSDVLGHVPCTIATPCSVFIRKGGTIICIVTGHRQYYGDLEQGGLDVPCKLQFEGSEKLIDQLSKILHFAAVPADSISMMRDLTNQPLSSKKYNVLCLCNLSLS